MTGRFLPGVPGEAIEKLVNDAGDEITSGKFDSPESSAALAANTFGWFLHRAQHLPPLPGCEQMGWPARSLSLEQTLRFPWSGGKHPVLDVLITTDSALIGIESKRFEPFRNAKPPVFSKAYWRDCWGNRMNGYEQIRDGYRYHHLNAAQLVKHAFALRTAVHNPNHPAHGLRPILFYLYAEPTARPLTGKPVAPEAVTAHRREIRHFANQVASDEVRFIACAYRTMLKDWRNAGTEIRAHAGEIIRGFAP